MGTQPYFMRPAPAPYPDWRFENLDEKDVISMHLDEHLGVPWEAFAKGEAPPAAWAAKINALAEESRKSGKVIYLAANPLNGFRRKLAGAVDEKGVKHDDRSPADSKGCYPFSNDPQVTHYQTAYINYCRYLLNLFKLKFFAPSVETNMQFEGCPKQKEAFIS